MFPQPNSVSSVLGGEQFWRLNTPLGSPGDLYESEVSALAFAVGPNSDLANYLVTYYDPEAPTSVSQLVVSPSRATVGRTSARNEVQYPGPGSRHGRILVGIGDIYDPTILPTGYSAGNDTIEYETPNIDFLQYFTLPPSLTPPRSDREFQYQYFRPPAVATHTSWLMIPAYGRKSGYFTFQNNDGGNIVTVTMVGLRLSTSNNAVNHGIFAGQALAAGTPGGSFQYAYDSSVDGLWDLLALKLANYHGNAMPVSITLSDNAL